MAKAINVIVVDDHRGIRDGLSQLLDGQEDMTVVGAAGSGLEAFSMARRLRPDVLILDIAMPDMNGLEAVKRIHRSVPETKIVVHSMYEKETQIHQAFSVGATGYVLKTAPSSDIINAIRSVSSGKYFTGSKMSPKGIDRLL